MVNNKSKWQQEFDALPQWAQKLVLAASSSVGYGSHDPSMIAPLRGPDKDQYTGFNVVLNKKDSKDWWDGWYELKELSNAITAPWPPPAPPKREKRALNVVELMADDQAFDQPCAFGNRVNGHAVYCHNEAWPNSPRKCRRNRDDYLHEDCPGFVANPDHSEPA